MKRLSSFSGLALLAVGLGLIYAEAASAQFFDETTSYRFLPRFSVLNEQGGIYPRDVDFRVRGTFDFTTAPAPMDVFPPVILAKFEEVDAWASHPILAYVLPLNQVLNLEGLHGRQIPSDAFFDVFKFEGETQDGSSVSLTALRFGPWLRLRGTTTPPPGSADMFTYSIRALARETPIADFDESDVVDGADLARWVGKFGSALPVADHQQGDANGDRVVDGTDFLAWQRQVGETVPLTEIDAAMDAALAASLTASLAAVPEPGSIAMVGVGAILLLFRRR